MTLEKSNKIFEIFKMFETKQNKLEKKQWIKKLDDQIFVDVALIIAVALYATNVKVSVLKKELKEKNIIISDNILKLINISLQLASPLQKMIVKIFHKNFKVIITTFDKSMDLSMNVLRNN